MHLQFKFLKKDHISFSKNKMEVDPALFSTIQSIVNVFSYENKLICQNVTHYSSNNKQITAIMLVTNYCFYLLEKNSPEKSHSIVAQIKWIDTKNIIFHDPQTFTISNNTESFKIGHPQVQNFLTIIIKHIENILLNNEKPEYQNCKSFLSKASHTHEAYIERFKYQIRSANIEEYPETLIKELTKVICRKTQLNIPTLPNSDKFAVYLLDCCQIEPTIRSIVVPQGLHQTYWNIIGKCLQTNTTLIHIHTNDRATDDIAAIPEALKNNPNSPLTQLTFSRTNFTPQYFQYLNEIVQMLPFKELAFENAITANDLNQLVDNDAILFAMTSAQTLTFKTIKGIILTPIISAIHSLKEINLINCQVSIDELMTLLPSTKMQVVRVYGGTATNKLNTKITLPSTLYSLAFDKITWEGNTLAQMWQLCIGHLQKVTVTSHNENDLSFVNPPDTKRDMVTLSFASATLSKTQWNDFFSAMDYRIGSKLLKELDWSENPFQPQILYFMMNCPKLHVINANGCFSPNSSNIQDFTDFLNASKTIKKLSIKGTSNCRLKQASNLFFDNLKGNTRLLELDVSDNEIGDEGLSELLDLLMVNKTIKKIRFENNDIVNPKSYYTFFDTLKECGSKLNILYPDKDLYGMYKANLIDGKSVNYIQDCYGRVVSADGDDDDNDSDDSDESDSSEQQLSLHKSDTNPEFEVNLGLDTRTASEAFLGVYDDWFLQIPHVQLPDTDAQIDAIARVYNTETLIDRLKSVK